MGVAYLYGGISHLSNLIKVHGEQVSEASSTCVHDGSTVTKRIKQGEDRSQLLG